jgi:hypothetical protein
VSAHGPRKINESVAKVRLPWSSATLTLAEPVSAGSERNALGVPPLLRGCPPYFPVVLNEETRTREGVDDPNLPTAVVTGHQIARKEVDRGGRHGSFRTPNLKGEVNDWTRSTPWTLEKGKIGGTFQCLKQAMPLGQGRQRKRGRDARERVYDGCSSLMKE